MSFPIGYAVYTRAAMDAHGNVDLNHPECLRLSLEPSDAENEALSKFAATHELFERDGIKIFPITEDAPIWKAR